MCGDDTMIFPRRRQHVVLFAAVIVLATSSVAYPQVPKAKDISACNVEAQRAVGREGPRVPGGVSHLHAEGWFLMSGGGS